MLNRTATPIREPGRARAWLIRIGLLLMVFLSAAALGELVCAFVAPCTFVKTDILGRRIANKPGPAYRSIVHGNETYADFVPGQQGTQSFLSDYRYHWEIDSHGLRNRQARQSNEATFRVLVLGDSQTFGIGVEQDSTYSNQLATHLSERARRPVEVLNAGVPGYGTFECLWKLERVAHELMPNLIVAAVFVDNAVVPDQGNDLWNNYVRMRQHGSRASRDDPKDTTRAKAKIPFLAHHSHLYGLLSLVRRTLVRDPSHLEKIEQYRLLHSDSDELRETWETTRTLIGQIAAQGQSISGAPTVVLHLPGLPSLALNDRSAIDELTTTDVPIVSAFDVLRASGTPGYLNLRYKHDNHYNELAHSLIAGEIASFIVQQGLIEHNAGSGD